MSTRQALAFSFLDRYAGLVLHTATAMVIARLLTPAELGVYSVVMVMIGLVAVFRDLGAGQYLVQHRSGDAAALGVTWTLQSGLGAAFALVVYAGAWPLAAFYRDERIVGIMQVVALNFLVTPLLAFPNAQLLRAMRFRTIAAIRFVGAIANAATAIGLAWRGLGPVALAWGNLATTAVGIAITALFARLPMWQRPTTQGLREALRFGGGLTAVALLSTVRGGAPELLLGKLQTLAAAGLTSRAQGLAAMFQQLVLDAVGAVALPYFARESRAGRELAPPFLRAAELILGLGLAFFGVLLVLAFPIVRLLYGLQWDESVPLLRWFAFATALALPATVCYSPLVALGAIREVVVATVVSTVVGVAATAIGAWFGPLEVAQAIAAVNALGSVLWLGLAKPRIGFGWAALAAVAARSAAVAAAATAPALVTILALGWEPHGRPFVALACLPLCLAAGALAGWATRHALWLELVRALPRAGRRVAREPVSR